MIVSRLKQLPLTVICLWVAVFGLSLVLPSALAGRFASPDETAVAVSIERLGETGSAAVLEPLAPTLPWLHPRSYVSVGEALLPVGFLGWPWWLSQFSRVLPTGFLPVLAGLLAASGVIPWYLVLRRKFGPLAAWWGTALAWTFPPVLLYLNRSYFTHIPQLALAIWALWLLVLSQDEPQTSSRKGIAMRLVAGLLLGVALSFRPIEAVWLLPLFYLAYRQFVALTWRTCFQLVGGAVIGLFPLAFAQSTTYGQWFRVGYWLRSNPDPTALVPSIAPAVPWYLRIAPYGLHPRAILWNVRSFYGAALWPWWVALIVGSIYSAVMFIARKTRVLASRVFKQVATQIIRQKSAYLILGFSVGWLLLIYGSGMYTDHIRPGAVTVGNSFLRYTLPFGFIFAWFAASFAKRLAASPRSGQILFTLFGALLMAGGIYGAFFHDDESLIQTRREVKRYAEIHASTKDHFKPGDVILSDRSDKIFFPNFRAVTPIPGADQLSTFSALTTSTSLGLFSRPLSFSERDACRRMGYDVRELQIFGRERLYRLTPFLR
jgi:hypothetical protein